MHSTAPLEKHSPQSTQRFTSMKIRMWMLHCVLSSVRPGVLCSVRLAANHVAWEVDLLVLSGVNGNADDRWTTIGAGRIGQNENYLLGAAHGG